MYGEAAVVHDPASLSSWYLKVPLPPPPAVQLHVGVVSFVGVVPVTLGAVGAVMSMVRLTAVEALLTLPAASVALAVRLCVVSESVELVMLQLPPLAVAVPSDVVPSVSKSSTVLSTSAVPLTVGVVSLVDAPSDGEVIDGADGAVVSASEPAAPPPPQAATVLERKKATSKWLGL